MRACFRRNLMAAAAIGGLTLALPAAMAAQQTGAISGRVVDSLARPVAGATISVDTLGRTTTTDSTGQFHLGNVPAGRRGLSMRAIGIVPMGMQVDVPANGTATAIFTVVRIGQHATALPTVSTTETSPTGKPARLDYTMKYDGFYERRASNGTSGLFYTHEDLEKMGRADLPDMLRQVPGLRLTHDIDRNELSFPGCTTDHILIMQDDEKVWPKGNSQMSSLGTVGGAVSLMSGHAPASGPRAGDPLEVIETLHLQNIEAMEIYKNMSSLPVFAAGEYCGAIIIWTR
jgi:hypothetical protein